MTQPTGTQTTGTQASGAEPTAPVSLGVSVVGDEIASVVIRSNGGRDEIAASNLVDLPDYLPESAAAAITELVESVPFEVDHLIVSCSRPSTRNYLAQAFTPGSSTPPWYRITSVDDITSAMLAVMRSSPGGAGVTAVVNLARTGGPADGVCVALVDNTTGQLLDTRDNSTVEGIPVTDARGADDVARLILDADGGSRLSSVVCTGSGAELPGVAPALEYAVGRPVSIAEMPALALAAGAAATPPKTTVLRAGDSEPAAYAAATPTRAPRDATGLRWWALGAVIGVAVLLGAIGLTALHASGDDTSARPDTTPTTVTVTDTPQQATVTREGEAVTETQTETRSEVRTTTVRPPTVTRTVEAPAATQTETTTVIQTTTVVVTEPGQSEGSGEQGQGTGEN